MQISLVSTIFLSTVILFSGCKKDDDPAPSGGGTTGPATLTASTAPTVQMTIEEGSISYGLSLTEGATLGSYTDHSEDIVTPPGSSSKQYSFILYRKPDLDSTVFAASLGKFNFQGSSPTNAQFFGFFPTGLVTYGNPETNNDRVAITWWDASGQEWSTYWGTDQTGSSFNITERLELPSTGVSSILMRATFTCKLYLDGGSGQFKQVTNGTGVFRYQNI